MKQGSAFSKNHLKDNIATLYERTSAAMQEIKFLSYGFLLVAFFSQNYGFFLTTSFSQNYGFFLAAFFSQKQACANFVYFQAALVRKLFMRALPNENRPLDSRRLF